MRALPKVTPTEIAEAVYQAQRAARAPAPTIGPAELPIPAARATYRPTVDGGLLKRLSDAAYADHAAAALPPAWRESVAKLLAADLEQRFPPADMAVLHRYGFAIEVRTAGISMPHGHRDLWMPLPAPQILPRQAANFSARAGEAGHHPVPDGAVLFCLKAAEVEDQRGDLLRMAGWPGRFKVDHKRYPRWEEIEAAWPILGAWMREQREGSRAD